MRTLFVFVFALCAQLAWAQELTFPTLNQTVVDEVQLLSANEISGLDANIRSVRQAGGPQIGIFVAKSLQGYPIEEFSIRLAEKWQLGTKEKDDGLLIVIAPSERQMRIEVGGGIEGEITDYESKMYIDNILVPAFRSQDFYGGLLAVIGQVGAKFGLENNAPPVKVSRRSVAQGPLVGALPFLLIVFVVINLIFFRKTALRGIFSGVGVGGAAFAMLGTAFLPIIIGVVIFSFILGLIGLTNLLQMLAMANMGHRGRGGYGGGGGFGGGSGGGWSGGGGGFSGGGSSGRW